MALALARCTDAHYSPWREHISVYCDTAPAAFLPGTDAEQLASATRAWFWRRAANDSIRYTLSHDHSGPLVSLAHAQRSRAAGFRLPVHQRAGRRALFSRLPAGGGRAVDGLGRLGLAGQHSRVHTLPSPWQVELAQRGRRWTGRAGLQLSLPAPADPAFAARRRDCAWIYHLGLPQPGRRGYVSPLETQAKSRSVGRLLAFV